jgi:sporulation protein YlmC with PRC-barrel domain
MLSTIKTVKGYKLKSLDGEIGGVKEFYFDDQYWAIRYMVADTGGWLPGRQVLISPYALGIVNNDQRLIAVDLTKKQIEKSPSLDSDKPVSRQFEDFYYGYYGWPTYWTGPYMWGAYPTLVRERVEFQKPARKDKAWNPHLRSTSEVSGYHIHAQDGEIGHVTDFVVDDETWTIHYLIVATQNWLPGKKVLISPKWIERVSWDESKVFVNLTRRLVEKSPEYLGEYMLNRDYENGLHRHYKREGYWVEEVAVHEKAR